MKHIVLALKKTRFPNDDFDSYHLPAQTVRDVLDAGDIPEIRLEEAYDGPVIAVLLAVEKHPERDEADYYIPVYYVEALLRQGGNPVFVGFDKTAEQLQNLRPRAILLPGGDFRLPPEWVENSQPEEGSMRREQAYEACINYARENKLPLLGICAGEQVLGGICGAKLKRVENHRRVLDNHCHNISIKPGSLLAKLCGLKNARVNSNHHMALSSASEISCNVSAVADDGVIEAIEPQNPWHYFVLGVQWHPERFAAKDDDLTECLFAGFIKAARGGFVHTHEKIPFAEAPLIEINDPHFIVDMMYAKADNISGQPVYEQIGLGNRAFVRRELWERLQKLIPWLEAHQMKLKIYDAYRPLEAHMALKAAIHEKGRGLFASRGETSKHCHGTAVDVALTDINGNELRYPTRVDCYTPEFAAQVQAGQTAAFYEYTKQGRHDYQNPKMAKEIANRDQLRALMESCGLISYIGEWWHYEMPDEFNLTFPVIEF